MKIVHSPAHELHAPGTFISAGRLTANPEKPERVERLYGAVRDEGHEFVDPESFGPAPRAAVHTVDYLEFLEHAHVWWRKVEGASEEVVPNAHPSRHVQTRPRHVIGLAGYHMADTACPITAGTWQAVCTAADVALTAARLVHNGARAAYALCRPPGHHAYADMAGGFCYLNNVAIAAQFLLTAGARRAAIVDVDVHHGNGTQAIFYDRSDVFFASIHADPTNFYPWFSGYAHERGAGAGRGYNLNLPLARNSDDGPFLEAIDKALAAVGRFAPNMLLISLGFDAQENDPLGVLGVTTAGFEKAGGLIATAGLPTVLVQEGGYICDELGANLAAFLRGFDAAD